MKLPRNLKMRNKIAVAFDIDGVLLLGEKVIPSASAALRKLQVNIKPVNTRTDQFLLSS
jgi:ribonucleotide monophosphatase NagD (HAD superfamily)